MADAGTDLHPGVSCYSCKRPVMGARFMCLNCAKFDLCTECEATICESRSHFKGQHSFAKIRDSRTLTTEKVRKYREAVWSDHDSFAFHTWNKDKLEHSKEALELVKRMLRQENEYRLGEEYQIRYASSQGDDDKTAVTQAIQERVVQEFQAEAEGIYANLNEGINFLRAAVGNFPAHLEELMECANYVRFTQLCKRGPLRVGDKPDISGLPLFHPQTGAKELLSDWLHPTKPLVILASSYT